jgi:hypothetical protein
VIVERVFKVTDEDGTTGEVKLQIGKPYRVAESNSSLMWRCPFQIIGVGSGKVHTAPGMDSLDALLLALRLAESYLLSERRREKITWLDDEDLGLPTFPSITEESAETGSAVFEQIFNDFFENFKRGD